MYKRKSSSTFALDLKISTGVSVHPSTVRRQLNTKGVKGFAAAKKEENLHYYIKTRLLHSTVDICENITGKEPAVNCDNSGLLRYLCHTA